jgi:hypothetical protein
MSAGQGIKMGTLTIVSRFSYSNISGCASARKTLSRLDWRDSLLNSLRSIFVTWNPYATIKIENAVTAPVRMDFHKVAFSFFEFMPFSYPTRSASRP